METPAAGNSVPGTRDKGKRSLAIPVEWLKVNAILCGIAIVQEPEQRSPVIKPEMLGIGLIAALVQVMKLTHGHDTLHSCL